MKLLKVISWIGIVSALLVPLVFFKGVYFPFVFPKTIFFQVMIGLTFPAYLMLAWQDPACRPPKSPVYIAILIYFGILILATIFALDPMRAFWGNTVRMGGLFTSLHFLMWLTMLIGMVKDEKAWIRLLQISVGVSFFMGVSVLLERYQFNVLDLPGEPARPVGLAGNSIYMAGYQSFSLLFIVFLCMRTRSIALWSAYICIGLVDLSSFLLVQARGPLIGLGAGVAVLFIFCAFFHSNKKYRWLASSGIVLLSSIYVVLYMCRGMSWAQQSGFERLFRLSIYDSGNRLAMWKMAWEGFLEKPFLGWGVDNLIFLFFHHYGIAFQFLWSTSVDRSHNAILDVLATTGIVGLVVYLSVFASVFYSIWRSFRKQKLDLITAAFLFALPVCYFVQNLTAFDHVSLQVVSFLVFGWIISLTGEPREQKSARTLTVWKGATLQACFVAMVWFGSILPMASAHFSMQAYLLFGTQAGLENMDRASRTWTPYLYDPLHLFIPHLIGIVRENDTQTIQAFQGWLSIFQKSLEKETKQHPNDIGGQLAYAQFLSAMALHGAMTAQKAEEHYRMVIEYSPKYDGVYGELAAFYLQQGKKAEADELYHQMLEAVFESGRARFLYAEALGLQSRYLEASREYVASQGTIYPYKPEKWSQLLLLANAEAYLRGQGEWNLYLTQVLPFKTRDLQAEKRSVLAAAMKLDPETYGKFLAPPPNPRPQ